MSSAVTRNGNDEIYTPLWLAEKVVRHFKPYGQVLEPCAGKKGSQAFIKALHDLQKRGSSLRSVSWMEIQEGFDFLESPASPFNKYDWIITNPPFSKFRPFLQKSLKLADNVVFLCPNNHVTGLKARMRDIDDHGFYVREIRYLQETPKEFPASGFLWAAHLLTKEKGPCIIDML